jgi:polysaccharide pyruvyl transferase CsaB
MIAIMGYYGHANIGDEAILACLVDQLGAMSLIPKVVVLTADPLNTSSTLGVAAVSSGFPVTLPGFLAAALGRSRLSFFRTLNTFRLADTLIVGGGGLFHDMPSTNRFLMELLRKIKWGLSLRKQVILLGVGIGPIYHNESRAALRNVLNRVELITVRDSDSRMVLEDIGVDIAELHTTADLAFLMKSVPLVFRDMVTEVGSDSHNGPKVALCLRSADIRMPQVRNAVVKFCKYSIEQLNARIWFVPFQIGGGEDDRTGPELIMQEIEIRGNVRLVSEIYSPAEMMGFLSQMDVVVGEKLHSLIFAINSRVPLLGISYQEKIEGLFKEIGRENWCIKLEELGADILIDRFNEIWRENIQIRSELETVFKIMKARSAVNFDILMRVLSGGSHSSSNIMV